MEKQKCIGTKKDGEPCGSWARVGFATCYSHRGQEHPGNETTHREPLLLTVRDRVRARQYWPDDKPLPGSYSKHKRLMQPCPTCRRVLTDDMGQAVICMSSRDDIVWLRCRCCEHRWPMPVKSV